MCLKTLPPPPPPIAPKLMLLCAAHREGIRVVSSMGAGEVRGDGRWEGGGCKVLSSMGVCDRVPGGDTWTESWL